MTSKDWKKYKLFEIAEFNPIETIKKGQLAKKIAMEKLIPYCKQIPSFERCKYNGGTKFRNGDTIMARITPCLENGKISKVTILNDNEIGFGSTEYIVFRAIENLSNPDFLYYLITSSLVREPAIKSMVGSSGRQRVQIDVVKNIEIGIPPLETQQKIARVLSAIDDKIELNNSINNNLEQQAQAIFKENISKNCNNSKNGCIGDYCAVKSGFAFKGSWWQNTGIKVIKIKTIDNDNINFNDCSYVSEDKIQYAKDFIVKGGDLLIAMTGATIGKFAIVPKVNETILVNQRVGKFFLGENPVQNLPFLYCTLKEQDVINEIINKGQGSAQPNISGSDIMNTLCYFPEKQNIVDFNNLCTPIFEKIINNKYENYHLIKLRDTLLPKLMSGEIDVSNVDISADKLLFRKDK